MSTHQVGDPATEWQRSDPDVVVYLPKEGDLNDGDNEHFLVFHAPKSDELLAMWTQSTCEGRGDNHLVLARSEDGENWSAPELIVGPRKGEEKLQASWGFPVVAAQGRIYCFYTKEVILPDGSRSGCAIGPLGCHYSDDNGHSWTEGADIFLPKNEYDHPDAGIPAGFIVWQKPDRDSKGRWLAGYSQGVSEAVIDYKKDGWWDGEARCRFMRFDNINEGPDPADVKITWLPFDDEGLAVGHRTKPHITSVSLEPSLVLLPDDRIFCAIRTMEGHIWYSVTEDDGETWRAPEVMRYRDGGEPVKQPNSPCPVYPLSDGRCLLVFHNNDGTLGEYSQWADKWHVNMCNHIRRPAFIALGEYRPNAHQPIWFSQPKQILDTNNVIVGPKRTAEIATYTSFTEFKGRRTLWYPDRKYYLLGKHITDELLADMVVE